MIALLTGVVAVSFATWQLLDYAFPWLKYDCRYLKTIFDSVRMLKNASKRKPVYTMVDMLVEKARDQPSKALMYFEDQVWTYKEMNDYSSRVAKVMWEEGIRVNDSVALLMHSCPEFVGVWFGVGKTGATTAFLNYNLHGKALLHCLKIADSKMLLVENDSALLKAVEDIQDEVEKTGIKIYVLGDCEGEGKFASLRDALDKQSDTEPPLEWRNEVTLQGHFCYVFTSGTTGLPKAALVRHDRALSVTQVMVLGGATKNDIFYTPLPLYHAAAGMMGLLGTLYLGCSIVVRRKFSAREFWTDCRKYNATVIQYIGETMRYVCDTPPSADDKKHCVRLAMGNGLRPLVWRKFLDRFGNDIRIMEFYSATEMNGGFLNLGNYFGSVGNLSPVMKAIGLVTLIRYDKDKEEAYRDENGRCVEVPIGTPGLMISKITPSTPFHGYRGNEKQTESKILKNVFKEGDSFFNSGDLLRRDEDYHVYFVDRTGDNYRWKGENVSTNEVSDIVSEAPGIKEANVYGVEVPGNEGRVGMVVVLLEDGAEFDCEGVYNHAMDNLAHFARPMFLRIKKELEVTGTFKQKKVKLVEQGFDPTNMEGDPVYFMDHREKKYVPLTEEMREDIITGQIRI